MCRCAGGVSYGSGSCLRVATLAGGARMAAERGAQAAFPRRGAAAPRDSVSGPFRMKTRAPSSASRLASPMTSAFRARSFCWIRTANSSLPSGPGAFPDGRCDGQLTPARRRSRGTTRPRWRPRPRRSCCGTTSRCAERLASPAARRDSPPRRAGTPRGRSGWGRHRRRRPGGPVAASSRRVPGGVGTRRRTRRER